ncbi:MAG: ImcF-related family protein [Paracoccaceae bacterium]|nr:ImcF-related family protein [Paracoccaceae bacterium]
MMLIDAVSKDQQNDAAQIAVAAERLLDGFAQRLEAAQTPPGAADAARYGLAVVVDAVVRRAPGCSLATWGALTNGTLGGGDPLSRERLETLAEKAGTLGPEYDDLARFLETCLARAQADPATAPGPKVWPALGAAVLLVLLAAGASFFWTRAEQGRAVAEAAVNFRAEVAAARGDPAALILVMDTLHGAGTEVSESVGAWAMPMPGQVAAAVVYGEVLAETSGPFLAGMLESAFASDGTAEGNYAHLRIWHMGAGAGAWKPAVFRAWLAARVEADPSQAGAAAHLARVDSPPERLVLLIPARVEDARRIAGTAPLSARIWVELRALESVAALPSWRAGESLPDLARVAERASGRALNAPVPGLFTQAGWDHAVRVAIPAAELAARAASQDLSLPLPTEEARADISVRLQRETIAAWRAFLDDLTLHPLRGQASAVEMFGVLGRSDSPLYRLAQVVWAESGAADGGRSFDTQLMARTAFDRLKTYADDGGFEEIAHLFGLLTLALARQEADGAVDIEALMSHGDRAQSISTLDRAPGVVNRIVRDVLVQTSQALIEGAKDPVSAFWSGVLRSECVALMARFPFGPGADLDLSDIAAALGPQSSMRRYMERRILPLIDTGVQPWQWRPEAQFRGYDPQSATFFQSLAALSALLDAPERAREVRLSLFGAAGGPVEITLGGVGQDLPQDGTEIAFRWPGTRAEAGLSLGFRGAGTEITARGTWGLARLALAHGLRPRESGRSYFLDVRDPPARLLMEVVFADEINALTIAQALSRARCPTRL